MDSRFREFDPEADTPGAGACKVTVGLKERSRTTEAKPILSVTGNQVVFRFSGEKRKGAFVLRALDGKELLRIPPGAGPSVTWKKTAGWHGIVFLGDGRGAAWKYLL